MITPRKKTSKKRTEIPPELLEQIEDLMLENFRDQLKRRVPSVTGHIYPEEIVLGVGLATPKQLKQPRFDVSIDYDPKKDNATKTIHLLVDLLAGLLEKLINEEDDSEFPLLWQDFDYEKKKVFIQYGTNNMDLEAEADKLLGIGSEGLFEDDLRTDSDEEADEILGETAETLKARLGFTDDGDDENEGQNH